MSQLDIPIAVEDPYLKAINVSLINGIMHQVIYASVRGYTLSQSAHIHSARFVGQKMLHLRHNFSMKFAKSRYILTPPWQNWVWPFKVC